MDKRKMEFLETSPNSGHTAPLCSAQIGSLHSATSFIRKTLSEIPNPALRGDNNG